MTEHTKILQQQGIARRSVLAGMAVTAALVPAATVAQPAPAAATQEQEAIALIRAWAAALASGDIEKTMSFMDEACQYRDDPFQTELKKGFALLRADLKMLLRGLNSMTIESAHAVGSAKNDVLVLVRRVDGFKLGDRQISMPMGAYYRVRNGKILEWLDTPMADMPPPPPGAVMPNMPKGPPPRHD